MLNSVGFFDNIPTKGLKSGKMQYFIGVVPKGIQKIRNPPSPAIENIEESDKLEGYGVKIIITSSIIDIYTRLEVLLGLKNYLFITIISQKLLI